MKRWCAGGGAFGAAQAVHLWTMRFAHRPACRGQRIRVAHRAGLRPQAPQPPTTINEPVSQLWSYRGDKYSDAGGPEAAQEALALRRQIEELQARLHQLAAHGPAGTESLAQGGDAFSIGFAFERQSMKTGKNDKIYWVKAGEGSAKVEITWDEIFARIAPLMIEPATSYVMVNELNSLIEAKSAATLMKRYPDDRLQNFRIYKEDYDTIKVQLRALGLIATTGERDSWGLTEYGDGYMNKLLAVHRKNLTGRPTGRAKARRST